MSSYKKLLHLKSPKIRTRAQEMGIDGRSKLSKVEKVAALADEPIEEFTELLDQNKDVLVEEARRMGLSTSGTKADLQERIVDEKLDEKRDDRAGESFPGSSLDGNQRKPHKDLESNFDTAEGRLKAIEQAAPRTLKRALEREVSQVLVESLLPRDETTPLSIREAYMKRHPDAFPVVEVQVYEPLKELSLGRDAVEAVGQQALKKALNEQVSYVVYQNGSPDDLEIERCYRDRDAETTPVMEILVPHVAYRVHKAEQQALRLYEDEEEA